MGAWNGAALEQDVFGELELPPELEASLRRHREHLARLVLSLRSAGVSEAQIEESVSVIIASYKDELIRTMKLTVR